MGADRNAILENAQLLAARGQFDKAILEWKKLTNGTPADGTIYNTIGDLHLKRNAPADAVEAYLKAAAAFREGEAVLKAIALYKKILKVDPTRTEAYRGLGQLNAERGLVSNAVSDYLALAKLHLQGGKSQEALEVYRTVAALDASNLEAQQRIAELAPAGQRNGGAPGQTSAEPVTGVGQASHIRLEGSSTSPDQGQRESLFSGPSGLQPAQRESELSLLQPVSDRPVTHEAGQTQGLAQWKPEWGRQDFINEAVRLTADDRYGEAESLLLELLGREPGDPEVCRLLATLHLRSGQLASAKVEFQFLAEAAIRAQDFKLAESMLSECLKTVPDCVSLLELLGRVYEQVGDAESASKRYGRALEVLVEQPDLEQPNLPLELYERIKAITPASPLMARFAPVCGSVSVRQGGGEAKQIEPVVCREERSWMVQEAGGTEQPPDRPSSAFKFAGPSRDREEARQAEETPSEPASPSPRSEPAFKFAEAASAPQAGPESQVPLPSCSQPLTDKVATGSTGLDDAAHYELGVAYRNMGLRDEAIEEFRLVGRGTTWFVEASLMLAACLKEQGQNRPALASLEEALADGSGNEDKVQSVRYELGLLYEAEGLFEQACQQFSLIPDFRDVPQRLEQMDRLSRAERPASAAVDPGSGGPPSEERPAPERKKRRVSYL